MLKSMSEGLRVDRTCWLAATAQSANSCCIHQQEWSVGVLTACFCMEHVDSA